MEAVRGMVWIFSGIAHCTKSTITNKNTKNSDSSHQVTLSVEI